MSQLGTYNPALIRYPVQRRPALDYASVQVPLNDPDEGLFPSILGIAAGFYLLSVITLSTASESTSWIPQVVGIALGILWIAVGVFFKAQPLAWSKPITLFVIFGAWLATGALVTIDFDYFMAIYMTTIKVTIVTWICMQCIRTRKDYLACCFLIGIAGCIILVVSHDQIMRAIEYSGTKEKAGLRVSESLIKNSNELGQVGVLMAFTSISCVMGSKNILMKVIAAVPSVGALYIVAASGSRQAMVGVIAIAIGMYWYHFRKAQRGSVGKKIIVIFLSLCILGGTLYYIQNLPFFFRLVNVVSSSDEAQKEPRFQYFLHAMGATVEHPLLGLGAGGFALARYGVNAENVGHYSHSTVSETLSCNGIPGFLLYFGSRLAFYLLAKRTQRLQLPARDLVTVRLMLAFVWALIMFDIVSVTFQDRLVWPWLGAACGYLWHLNHRFGRQELATA